MNMINSFFKKSIKNQNIPLGVTVELNNVCNAKCTFCAYGKEKIQNSNLLSDSGKILDVRPKQHLSKNVFNHLLKLCSLSGAGMLKKISFTPILGEVTVSKNWLELVSAAKSSKGVKYVSSYTNAINLHLFTSKAIIDSGLDVLQISTSLVDRESYKRIYGRDKYAQVLNNVIDILKTNHKNGSPVDIYINLRIDLPKEKFIRSDAYQVLSKYIEKRKITFLEKYDDYGGTISKKDLPKGAVFVDIDDNSGRPPCYQLYRQLMVNIDGTIQACTCRTHESLMTRNILEYDTLESAWKNDKLEKIRSDWEKGILPIACKHCTHYGPYEKLEQYYKIYPRIKLYILSIITGSAIYTLLKKLFKRSGSMSVSATNKDNIS